MLDSLAALPSIPWESFEPRSLDVVTLLSPSRFPLYSISIPHLFTLSTSPAAKRKRNSKSEKQRRRTEKDNCISLVLEEVIYLSLVTYTRALLIPPEFSLLRAYLVDTHSTSRSSIRQCLIWFTLPSIPSLPPLYWRSSLSMEEPASCSRLVGDLEI
ncbi:hypothetical protein BJX68DRAFT_136465 [Aspergillus pseudodeflectus]|uniref:Uncharacterized protein n=1 Tax=Aspergillus pseudodeflectus TaxID=176178 RepID=A0ABR4JYM8_9EURO